MPSVSGVVELTCFCVHVIVDTHAVVFVVTLQLAGLNINNNLVPIVWFTKRLLMKKKGGGNASIRQLSETRTKQFKMDMLNELLRAYKGIQKLFTPLLINDYR